MVCVRVRLSDWCLQLHVWSIVCHECVCGGVCAAGVLCVPISFAACTEHWRTRTCDCGHWLKLPCTTPALYLRWDGAVSCAACSAFALSLRYVCVGAGAGTLCAVVLFTVFPSFSAA